MSHPGVSLVNNLLSITRVSLVQNKCVFCQLRVHYMILYFKHIIHIDDFQLNGHPPSIYICIYIYIYFYECDYFVTSMRLFCYTVTF